MHIQYTCKYPYTHVCAYVHVHMQASTHTVLVLPLYSLWEEGSRKTQNTQLNTEETYQSSAFGAIFSSKRSRISWLPLPVEPSGLIPPYW